MLPVVLNLSMLHVVLVGNGEALKKRLAQIQKESPRHLSVFTEDNLPTSPEEQGWMQGYAVIPRLPETHEIRQASILLVTGLEEEKAAVLSSIARLQGILVWVEDKPELCDFYFTSYLERGDLTISVSTGGASPTLARRVRETLEGCFGKEWIDISKQVAERRQSLKEAGLSAAEINSAIEKMIEEHAWFKRCQLNTAHYPLPA